MASKFFFKGFSKVFKGPQHQGRVATIGGVKPNVPTTKLEKVKSKLKILKQKTKTSALKLKNTLEDIKEKSTKRENKMGGGMMGRRFGMKKGSKFPDLTGDGKVTQADILKGRGVINGKKKGKA
jgi:hypothetical protein